MFFFRIDNEFDVTFLIPRWNRIFNIYYSVKDFLIHISKYNLSSSEDLYMLHQSFFPNTVVIKLLKRFRFLNFHLKNIYNFFIKVFPRI